VEEEAVAMVILSCGICLSLGASIAFLAAGMFANGSSRLQRDA